MPLYLTITTPVSGDHFEILSVNGEEHISALFTYTITLGADDLAIDSAQLLGKAVTISFQHEDATTQYRNGIVTRLGKQLDQSGQIIYLLEVSPWLWLLTRGSDCRIFQNKTVPEIIEQIFGDLGKTDFRNALTKTYTAREYCVQYDETHFNFISRLMEEEGIFYFFDHEDGKHTLVLGDDSDAHVKCPGVPDAVKFKLFGAEWIEHDVVISCTLEEQVVPAEFKVDDYNFETPDTDLAASTTGSSAETSLKLFEYPGNFSKKDAGEAIAKTRIEEQEFAMKLISGSSNCRDFLAGGKFTLKDNYRPALNGDYVLRTLRFSITQDGYTNNFQAFPSAVPFRPSRVTQKRLMPGYQVAKVVGKSGEEIWTDSYGRVKVSFPWDSRSTNDENSSCWIRVAHPWAGKGWGTIAIPRIGTEVLISFLDGDPDRPIIVGTLYNAAQTVPYTLPDEGTKTTIKTNSSKGGEGYNEMRFEDKKGSEQIFIHGEKDLDIRIKNDAKEWYGNEHHTIVTKNQYLKVSEERHTTVTKDDITKIDGERHLKLAKDDVAKIDGAREVAIAKDDKLKIDGAMHLKVTGDCNQKVDGGVSLDAGMNHYLKAGQNHAVDAGMDVHIKGGMNVVIEAGMTVTIKAGGGFIVVGPAGVTISGNPVMINSGGSAGSGSGSSPTAPGTPKDPKDVTDAKEAPEK